jgi:hypothetical protein
MPYAHVRLLRLVIMRSDAGLAKWLDGRGQSLSMCMYRLVNREHFNRAKRASLRARGARFSSEETYKDGAKACRQTWRVRLMVVAASFLRRRRWSRRYVLPPKTRNGSCC